MDSILPNYMVDEFTQMSEADFIRLLTSDNVGAITSSRISSGIESLSVDGIQATVSKTLLGSGGSKEVYDVTLYNQHYALALPGIVDPARIIIAKWGKVLREPANTDRLRDLGFYVNGLCKVVPAKVNGHEFPALIMKRYSDHGFPIYDSKNPQSRYHELIKQDEQVTDETALALFVPIGIEIATLVRNGAKLGSDCINLCDINGIPHLYFNDLGAATFGEIPQGDLERYVDHYVSSALGAFVNTVAERVYRGNLYVHSMADLGSSLQPKLVKRVMATLAQD